MAAENPLPLLSDALEASYYLAPEEPGLSHDEISALLKQFGHSIEEIAECLVGISASERFTIVAGNIRFQADFLPPSLARQELTFEDDPRSVEAYTFIISQLQQFDSLSIRSLPIALLLTRGVNFKHREAALILGLHALSWMKKIRIVDDYVSAMPDILKEPAHRSSDFLRERISARRARFHRAYESVKKMIEARPQNIAFQDLLDRIQAVKLPHVEPASPAATLLERAIAFFADIHAPALVDDIEDSKLGSAAAVLERHGLIRRTQDNRLVPTIAALARTPRLHRVLFESLDAILDGAHYIWHQLPLTAKQVSWETLISKSRLERPSSKIHRQIRGLINASILEPVIFGSSTTETLRVGPDIVTCRTASGLLKLQLISKTASSNVRSLIESREDYSKLLEGAIQRALADPLFANDLRQLVTSRDAPRSEENILSLQRRIQSWLLQQPSSGSLHLPWASLGTEAGGRNINQDRVAAVRLRTERGLDICAFILCDGIGSMEDGELSASIAISSFVSQLLLSEQSDPKLISNALQAANSSVLRSQRGKGGTTFTAVVSLGPERYICHVGDSSVSAFDDEGALVVLTPNDTLGGHLHSMGLPSDPEADLHGRLIQYLGMEEGIEAHISRVPDNSRMLLIASDGATWPGFPIVRQLARGATSLHSFTSRLLKLSRWLGGEDNATCIAISSQAWSPAADASPGYVEMWGIAGKLEFLSANALSPLTSPRASASTPAPNERASPRRRPFNQPRFRFTNSSDDEDEQVKK